MSSQRPTQVHGERTHRKGNLAHTRVHTAEYTSSGVWIHTCKMHAVTCMMVAGAIHTHTCTCQGDSCRRAHVHTGPSLYVPMDSFPVAPQPCTLGHKRFPLFNSISLLILCSAWLFPLLLSLSAPPPALFLCRPDPHVTLFSCHPCLCLFPACPHKPCPPSLLGPIVWASDLSALGRAQAFHPGRQTCPAGPWPRETPFYHQSDPLLSSGATDFGQGGRFVLRAQASKGSLAPSASSFPFNVKYNYVSAQQGDWLQGSNQGGWLSGHRPDR